MGGIQKAVTTLVQKSALTNPAPDSMSFEEFLDWADEDTFAEWVEGKVVYMSPVSWMHQNVAAFLLTLINHFADGLGIVRKSVVQGKSGDSLAVRSRSILLTVI